MRKGKETRSVQLSVRLTPSIMAFVQEEAERDMRTIADVVLLALHDRYADRMPAKPSKRRAAKGGK